MFALCAFFALQNLAMWPFCLHLKHFSFDSSALLTYLDFYIEKYDILENEFLITATFLNPKYKKFSNASEEDKKKFIKKASNYLKVLFVERPYILKSLSVPVTQPTEETSINENKCRMSDSEDDDSGEQSQVTVAKLRAELKQYINEPKHTNAAEFWAVMEKSQNKSYPILFVLYLISFQFQQLRHLLRDYSHPQVTRFGTVEIDSNQLKLKK